MAASVWVVGDSIYVALDEAQMARGARVGRRRAEASVGRKPRFPYTGRGQDTSVNRHIQGAQAELAFCVVFGIEWDEGVNTFKAPDAGALWEIRYSASSMWKVAPEDPGDRRVACIRGTPPTFEIRGWILSRLAKKIPLTDPGDRGRKAHFLTTDDLNLFDTRRWR